MELSIVICTRETPEDTAYLNALLANLESTDMPKDSETLGYGKEYSLNGARLQGAREAIGDFVLFVDVDTVMPPGWWGEAKRVMDSDSKIVALLPCVSDGGYLPSHSQQQTSQANKSETGVVDLLSGGLFFDMRKNHYDMFDYPNDCCILMRRDWLVSTWLYPKSTFETHPDLFYWVWFPIMRGKRVVVADRILVHHAKGKRNSGENPGWRWVIERGIG